MANTVATRAAHLWKTLKTPQLNPVNPIRKLFLPPRRNMIGRLARAKNPARSPRYRVISPGCVLSIIIYRVSCIVLNSRGPSRKQQDIKIFITQSALGFTYARSITCLLLLSITKKIVFTPINAMTASTCILVGRVTHPMGSRCLCPNNAGSMKCFLIHVHAAVPLESTAVALVLREIVDSASRCVEALKSMFFARYL